ncbi:MAG: hypothetical protein WDN28_22465 [Chthoniobacter sp.]
MRAASASARAALPQRRLHEIRDEDREAHAKRQRGAIGVEEQRNLQRLAGALLQHERAVFALRENS